MNIFTSFFLSILLITTMHSTSMEDIATSDIDATIPSSALINLPVEASIVFIAHCTNKNVLRATCSHFRDLASRKNATIFTQPMLQLTQEALDHFIVYFCALNKSTIVDNLLKKGANPHTCDNTGTSLMQYAARYGYSDIATLLLKYPAFITTNITNNERSPLFLAIKHNQHAIIKQILQECQVTNEQILCYAVKEGSLEIVRTLLLTYKMNANAVDDKKLPPLWHAIMIGGDAYLPIIKLLLDNGAETNTRIKKNAEVDKKFARYTPFHLAVKLGHIHTTQLLIDYGANVDLKDKECKTTPLHLASINGHLQIVKALLHNNAHVDEKDINGNTPLISASHQGHIEIVETLIDNKANVNAKDNKNSTPLYRAATNGRTRIVQLLIAYNADVTIKQTENNDTPLHMAAYRGHADIVEILLDNDASINEKNNDNLTPLDVAKDDAIKELLIAYGGKKSSELKAPDNDSKAPDNESKAPDNCVVQ